jgi:hypothetical protein
MTQAPTGRIRKPTAKMAATDRSWAVDEPSGKKTGAK